MIVQDSSGQTDFTAEFPWKSPIARRSNFDRVLVWLLVMICVCVAVGFGLILLFPNGFSGSGREFCGVVDDRARLNAFEEPQLEQPLLTIQNFDGSFGNLAWEVKAENPEEGKSYRKMSYSLYNDSYIPADFNDGEIIMRIDDPAVVRLNQLYIKYETDEGRSQGPLMYNLNFRAYIDALQSHNEREKSH